ncbi:potassium channel family protein [Garciella nitratireducens]|uniref:Trk system potassium uptake protein TrkA n=1 Tax=Garciella nitratireducens DSM 15102 TaxID=1121911 RepID=A0A1T4MAX9_9FIRM|nr:TrkA family potassium uptake protein [Garciella nitratireducens]RBP37422.1 trk system potassium uptake protein TrkA [Garciella nitratireducens]SJZ64006.1 trk system potassium uptake protein TrkA [Garciella nitratireducens DSM 15102]
MKSVLIIGMGAFGRHLALKMIDLKNDVMIIDKDESVVEEMSSLVTDAQIGDCTKEEVLKAVGVSNFDICFVTIGDDFQSSLEITALLEDLGAKRIISKASRDIQAKFLLRNGADEVIYPDKDMAEKLALRYSLNNIFDYFEVTPDYLIFELPIMKNWIGSSVEKINIRKKYHINILIIKNGDSIMTMPKADYVFQEGDSMIAFGRVEDVMKLNNIR